MFSIIDRLLNKITMYRLVLYGLIFLLAVAGIFGMVGILPINPIALIFSIGVLTLVSLAANDLCARIFKAQPNSESVYITALILALIITPVMPQNLGGLSFLVWAAVLAMVSKYILAANKKHIFNPAAIAVAITAFALGQYASWWIGGNLPMLAFVLITGLLITRKIQRFDLVLTFFAAALISCILFNSSLSPWEVLQKAILHTSLLFFGFVMLTEPLTTPPTRDGRIAYGLLVGFMFPPQFHIGGIYSTPELALIVGNIFSYLMSPKSKYVLTLEEKREVGAGLYDFAFTSDAPMKFRPGQYMEFTLAHKNNDTRGNRRYFTLASSPTEPHAHLGVRFPQTASSFKNKMLSLQPGDTMVAGQLAGDFILPKDASKKLAFIAGGIGITPFRSMIKYLADRGEKRDVVLFYSNRHEHEIAYREVFDEAAGKIGLKTIYTITGKKDEPRDLSLEPRKTDFTQGSRLKAPDSLIIPHRINADLIRREVPDYLDRTFYISGTQSMVSGMAAMLRKLGVPRRQIVTDFFPGF